MSDKSNMSDRDLLVTTANNVEWMRDAIVKIETRVSWVEKKFVWVSGAMGGLFLAWEMFKDSIKRTFHIL